MLEKGFRGKGNHNGVILEGLVRELCFTMEQDDFKVGNHGKIDMGMKVGFYFEGFTLPPTVPLDPMLKLIPQGGRAVQYIQQLLPQSPDLVY